MNTELTNGQIIDFVLEGWGCRENDHSDHVVFARAVIAADRALQDARHREELAAYELTVANLRAAQGRNKHWHDTAWDRGHQMGMAANRDIARQATEALAKEREAHAETNHMMTEALMQAESAQGTPDGWVLVPVEPSIAACINGSDAVGRVVDGYQCADVYRAMLAAAPCAGCGETCKRAKLCATCAGEIAAAQQPAAQPERGQIVVTKNEAGRIVAVTRQDEDGKILEVIATDIRFEREPEPKPTSVSLSKRAELEADGYVVNGLALMHPETRRRVLLDYCGFVGWYGLESEITRFRTQQERKPMTRNQVDDLAEDGVFLRSVYEIVQAVEAFHGIKDAP